MVGIPTSPFFKALGGPGRPKRRLLMMRFFHIRNCDSVAAQQIIICHCHLALERVTPAPSANDFPFEGMTYRQGLNFWLWWEFPLPLSLKHVAALAGQSGEC